MFKKIITFICLCCILTFSVSAGTEPTQKPTITSSAYVLYNPKNNEVVDSINKNVKMYPASLTKMLTALVAVSLSNDIDKETATVSENAVKSLYGTSSSTSGIKIGEILTIRQLLYLLILPSGNDAANVLAEHFCNDNFSFAELMNDKAKEIGMNDSNFVNPHGLHNENHYSTAKDLAILADNFSNNEILANISNCGEYTLAKTNKQQERKIRTTNLLKVENSGYYYKYAIGLKTGNTEQAGRCLAAFAQKNGVNYICVLLNCPEKWLKSGMVRSEFLEAASIFEYAFSNYKTVQIASKGQRISEETVYETFNKKVDIVLENDVFATLPIGTNISNIKYNYSCEKLNNNGLLIPPINYNDYIGKVSLVLDNKVLAECNVVANNQAKAHWWLSFWHKIDFYVYLFIIIFLSLVLILFLLFIRAKIVIYKRKKLKAKRLKRRKLLQEEFNSKEPIDYFNIKNGQ